MMKRTCLHCSSRVRYLLVILSSAISFVMSPGYAAAQTKQPYTAPQDTGKVTRLRNESLSEYHQTTKLWKPDSRMINAARKAAKALLDTNNYDNEQGILLERLLSKDDLEYAVHLGVNGVVALFELINKNLPNKKYIDFRTADLQDVTTVENSLILKDLRVMISDNPATLQGNKEQWKQNVYQAYMARDYGTKLNNTITITAATREIREVPELELVDFNRQGITLGGILARQQTKRKTQSEIEKAAVADFRLHTFPGPLISKEDANNNYRRALFELIRLQQEDISKSSVSRKVIVDLTEDLKKGNASNVINALKNSTFFNANVPGNLGPVLLTEDHVISVDEIAGHAAAKAMELSLLTSLHYGQRDADKLFRELLSGNGASPAVATGIFTSDRLNDLTDHGTEKLKSLGFEASKSANVTIADLVLVAVASPDAPVVSKPRSFINLHDVGVSIVNQYSITNINIQETKNMVSFNPRLIIGSRHTEYRAAFDAVDFVPKFINGIDINQRGSQVVQNGIEIRLESDIYFSNPTKIISKGIKPVIFPEFGIIAGTGRRSVGYNENTTLGEHGPVPKFKSKYVNWGGHLGLNVGPFMVGADATLLSTPGNEDPYKRFFDLSQGMTYYRYTFLIHIFNFSLNKNYKSDRITLDTQLTGETNNEWVNNSTGTQSSGAQNYSSAWVRNYDRAHPGGQYDAQIATEMILDGDVKATYAASNYATITLGIQQATLHFKASVGLYGLYTVNSNNWVNRVFENTIEGNVFGSVGVTYNFRAKSVTERRQQTETYKSNINISPKKAESISVNRAYDAPRDHAIFKN